MVKAAAGPGAEARSVADPTPGRGEVVVRVEAASVCGTDREMVEWTPAAEAFGLRFPVVLGHEGAGPVVAVAPDVDGLRVGDRVALESHLACGTCYPCRTGDGHDCAATGILGLAAALGATAVGPDADVVDLARTATGRRGGVDVAFEVSAAPGVLPTLFEAVRREGTVVTVGHPARPQEIDVAAHVNKKGVTLRGVFGRRLWDTWEHMGPLVSSGRLDLSWLVTHRMGLEELPAAVELLSGEAAKVLLLPAGP